MTNNVTVFDFSQARTITRPLFFDHDFEHNTEIKNHFIFTKLKDLPSNIPLTPNPRKPNLQSVPCKRMFDTLERNPEYFTDCNRGLLFIAKKVKFTDSKEIIIDWGSDDEGNPIGGLVDGGHTYEVLKKTKKEEASLQNLPVFISILEGVDEFASTVARARNTSVQVKETSIANLEKQFDLLKKALGNYSSKIIFYENENKASDDAIFPIEEVISILTSLNIGLYDDVNHPTVSYSGSSSCFNKWLNKKHRPTYEKLYPIVPEILELYEFLYINFEKFAKEAGIIRFNGINGIEKLKKIERLPFTNKKIKSKISKAFLLPIFASLRFLLIENNGKLEWGEDPQKFLNKNGANLIKRLFNAHTNEYASNPNKTGKSKMLWENIANTVQLLHRH